MNLVFVFQGMGGQFEYFGFWIDSSFGKGHSKAGPKCTTYGSPQLSGKPEFEVELIEVWAVGPEKKVEEDLSDEVCINVVHQPYSKPSSRNKIIYSRLCWGGVAGGVVFNIDMGTTFAKINAIVYPRHIFQGMFKAAVFGLIISLISCFKGFQATGGAKGVGKATTQAVVYTLVSILIANFIITYFQYEQAL